MLSIATLKNASQATSYYEADNYYAKDSPEAKEASTWWGKGAQLLGLSGTVEPEQFQSLLEGQLPNGQRLGRIENGAIVHRPGIDLTFSAPKSVSVLSEIGGDKRIHAAHAKAVDATLSYLQTHAAQTRHSDNGEIVFDKTDNLIVAQFRHDTSREHDPQLHTHCVLINATQREDGQWRSLSCEPFFEQKMLAGTLYRATLAFELQQHGYTIEKPHVDGRFEIAGVLPALIETFSKRRQHIEAALQERGLDGAKAAESAALLTRHSKTIVDRDQLREQWKTTCENAGFDAKQVVHEATTRSHENREINYTHYADQSVQFAEQHLSEREAVFTQEALLKTAVAHGIGHVSPQHITAAITRAEKQHALLSVTREGVTGWTTPQALHCEKETINAMLDGRQTIKPIAITEKVDAFLSEKSYLNQGQQNAVKLILTTQDRIVGIQGYAGAGKTTMLAAVKEFAQTHGFQIKGLAPSAAAANQIREGAGIESTTLASYFLEHAKQGQLAKSAAKTIFVLDESSMASTTQMNRLLKSIHHNKGRLVLVGDTQQLGAVEAGKPFYQLQKAGMATAVMNDILRQKEAPLLEQAVHDTINGDINKALEKISNNVCEVTNKEERLQQLANHYLSLPAEKREAALVLTPANEDRACVNTLIRDALKKSGYLKGETTQQTILINRGLTRAERTQVGNYAISNVVRFNKSFPSLHIKTGDYLEVAQIDRKTNTLFLKHKNEKITAWQPDKIAAKREGTIEVYQKEQRELIAGDTIRWLRNDRQNAVFNSESAKILTTQNHITKVELQNGKTITLDLSHQNHQHWDHAYATTVHAAQGKTCDIVIAHGESFRKNLTNQQGFYVTISRARHEVHLYTDDKSAYLKTLHKFVGEKTSALEYTPLQRAESAVKASNLSAQKDTDKSKSGREMSL